MRKIYCVLGILLYAIATSSRSQVMDIGGKYAVFEKAVESSRDLSSPKQADFIKNTYSSLFSGELAKDTSTERDLGYLFKAANIDEFFIKDPNALDNMVKAYDLMRKKGVVSEQYTYSLYGSFIDQRKFRQAEFFAKENHFPVTDSFSIVNELSATPGKFSYLDGDGGDFFLKHLDLARPYVVVVASPLCHFTVNAFSDIARHQDLLSLLERNSILLVPQDRDLYLKALRNWNKNHPKEKMYLVYHESDWPSIDAWETPTFYFFKDGKVVSKVVGWPAKGNISELRKGLHSVGLL